MKTSEQHKAVAVAVAVHCACYIFIALVSSRHNMLIVCHPQLMATLNKRNELVSSCRHRRTTFLSIVNVH